MHCRAYFVTQILEGVSSWFFFLSLQCRASFYWTIYLDYQVLPHSINESYIVNVIMRLIHSAIASAE